MMPAAVARTKIRIISAPRDRDLSPDVTHRVQLISHYLARPHALYNAHRKLFLQSEDDFPSRGQHQVEAKLSRVR